MAQNAQTPQTPDTRQYVISAPTGFALSATGFGQTLETFGDHMRQAGISFEETLPQGPCALVELTEVQFGDIKTRFPSLVIEPNIRYRLLRHPLLEGFRRIPVEDTKRPLTVTVIDEQSKKPLAGVTVVLVVSRAEKRGVKGRTGEDGTIALKLPIGVDRFEMVGLLPQAGYWSRKLDNVSIDSDKIELFLRPLPPAKNEIYAWGADDTHMTDGAADGGAGVKIAVIDTGIRKDHPDLRPAGGVNCVEGEDPEMWHDDNIGHGTHCAGIIGALLNQQGIKSYAPKAQTYAYRVFSNDEDTGATTFAIVKALSRAIADGVDVISMSLGSGEPQSAIRTQMEHAYDKGIVCVVASGNEGGPVSYPAAFHVAMAVGAYGRFGTYPDDSLQKGTESDRVSEDRKHFVANFSNFGEEVDFIAPGVAILSTVPKGYAAWDGTSMACPHVTGMVALALASHPDLLKAPRNAERAERIVKLMAAASRKLGLGGKFEGAGCPQVDLLIKP